MTLPSTHEMGAASRRPLLLDHSARHRIERKGETSLRSQTCYFKQCELALERERRPEVIRVVTLAYLRWYKGQRYATPNTKCKRQA